MIVGLKRYKLKILKGDHSFFSDIDETLIMHNTIDKDIVIQDPYDGKKRQYKMHKKHIKLLKDHKARGYTVIVWTANGYKWAKAVVKALGLKKHVDLIMTKPSKFCDDLPAEGVLGPRIYLEDTP